MWRILVSKIAVDCVALGGVGNFWLSSQTHVVSPCKQHAKTLVFKAQLIKKNIEGWACLARPASGGWGLRSGPWHGTALS